MNLKITDFPDDYMKIYCLVERTPGGFVTLDQKSRILLHTLSSAGLVTCLKDRWFSRPPSNRIEAFRLFMKEYPEIGRAYQDIADGNPDLPANLVRLLCRTGFVEDADGIRLTEFGKAAKPLLIGNTQVSPVKSISTNIMDEIGTIIAEEFQTASGISEEEGIQIQVSHQKVIDILLHNKGKLRALLRQNMNAIKMEKWKMAKAEAAVKAKSKSA